jgi:hypothetical protein
MQRGVNGHGQVISAKDVGGSAAHSGHAKEIITRLKKVNEGPNS